MGCFRWMGDEGWGRGDGNGGLGIRKRCLMEFCELFPCVAFLYMMMMHDQFFPPFFFVLFLILSSLPLSHLSSPLFLFLQAILFFVSKAGT